MVEEVLILREIEDYELFHSKVLRLIKRSRFSKEKLYLLLIKFMPSTAAKFFARDIVNSVVNSFRPNDPIHKFSDELFAVAVTTTASIPVEIFEVRLEKKLRQFYIHKVNFLLSFAIAPYESTNYLSLLKIAHNRLKEKQNAQTEIAV